MQLNRGNITDAESAFDKADTEGYRDGHLDRAEVESPALATWLTVFLLGAVAAVLLVFYRSVLEHPRRAL